MMTARSGPDVRERKLGVVHVPRRVAGVLSLLVLLTGTNGLTAGSDRRLADAAKGQNWSVVRALLNQGLNPNASQPDGTTALHWSAHMIDAVTFVIETAHADVNAVNEAGFAAIHGAAYVGDEAILQYLLEHGAKSDVTDFRGRTPYRIAEGHKNGTDFVEYPYAAELLKRWGADTSLGVNGRVAEREGVRLATRAASANAKTVCGPLDCSLPFNGCRPCDRQGRAR